MLSNKWKHSNEDDKYTRVQLDQQDTKARPTPSSVSRQANLLQEKT